MKTKTITAVTAALSLAACASAVVWKSPITDASLTGSALALATDSESNSYQLYPVGTQLYLRKLDTQGTLLWQQSVDDTLTDSGTSPQLEITAAGPAVAYQDTTSKLAFLRQFDSSGLLLWSTDFGSHSAETLHDLASSSDGSLTVALKLSATQTNVLHVDAAGALLWETALPKCLLLCSASLGVAASGETLAVNAEATATKSYLLDIAGAQVWSRSKSTGITTAGIVPNTVLPTGSGFALTHPLTTWSYDLAGNLLWSQSQGSAANLASDASGNLYLPHGTTISRYAADGTTLLNDIALSGQVAIDQIEWREDLQRLIVLSRYETAGAEIDATITDESGYNLFVFDATGAQKAKYKGKATQVKTPICTPIPDCVTVTVIPGESWGNFATTADKKILVSGLTRDSERFAKAYKLP